MNLIKLSEIPKDIANSSSEKQIQIAYNYVSALDNSGELIIYSLNNKTIIYQESNVSSFIWLFPTNIPSPIFAILNNNKIKLISFIDHLDDYSPSDEKTRISAFTIQKHNEYCSILTEFSRNFTISKFVPFYSNTLLLLDRNGTLHHLSIFPDGVYYTKSCSSLKCSIFSFSGTYLLGEFGGKVQVWGANLQHVCACDVGVCRVCPVSPTKFALIHAESKFVDLFEIDEVGSKAVKSDRVEVSEETDFITIFEDGSVFAKPARCVLVSTLYYAPLFLSGSDICTFKAPLAVRRVADAFPSAFSPRFLVDTIRESSSDACVDFVAKIFALTWNVELFEKLHNEAEATASASFLKSFEVFRTLVLQEAWSKVCSGRIEEEAAPFLVKFGEDPIDNFYEMWKCTTRNGTRQRLYEYLCRVGRIQPNSEDDRNQKILKSITERYPNTSYVSKVENMSSHLPRTPPGEDAMLPPQWEQIVDVEKDFDENESMIFPELFNIKKEDSVKNGSYFVGNIRLIESQSEEGIKNFIGSKEHTVDKLYNLHCELRIKELVSMCNEELNRGVSFDKLASVKFVNKYYDQLNTYELESLLDLLCNHGYFASKEYDNFDLLLGRICKNRFLFDENWWSNRPRSFFFDFFKEFANFCGKKNLFMPFEMFVLSHQREVSEIDIADIEHPMIKFIWDLWMKHDPSSANLSCLQFVSNSTSTDPVELWKGLPKDSLAPLGSFVWNKDPSKFKKGSRETEALSSRLREDYPMLAALINDEIPHPRTPVKTPPPSKWRSPIYTSKNDLELHDLIESHFAKYDFSKVFTSYYQKCPGEENFPHFDHPELIKQRVETPYAHYVKLKLPVSAFQQAVEDNVSEERLTDISIECMKEALKNEDLRLSVLSFIELIDMKFKAEHSIDYKISVQLYDLLISQDVSQDKSEQLVIDFYVHKKKESVREVQKIFVGKTKTVDIFLLLSLLQFRCGLELDYAPIVYFSQNRKPSELLLFIDEASELGLQYSVPEVEQIVEEKMPKDEPLRAHIIFHLKQSHPNDEGSIVTDIPALVVYRAVKKENQEPYISLLQESLKRKVELYALLATSIKGSNMILCAYVTMLTKKKERVNFDVTKELPHEKIVALFLNTLQELLQENKSMDLLKTLELFTDNSIVMNMIVFYRSIELFAFKRAESSLQDLNKKLTSNTETISDDLLKEVPTKLARGAFFNILESLVKYCAKQSQVHLFLFLRILDGSIVPDSLDRLVSLCRIVAGFKNYNRAIVRCDLLGPPSKLVHDFVLNHSLGLGQAAARILGVSSDSATNEWLSFQYSNASTPAQVLEIHNEIVSSIENVDPRFFVYLFCSLLPYEQPVALIPFLSYAKDHENEVSECVSLCKCLSALLLHLDICKERHFEVKQSPGGLPSLSDVLRVVFPGEGSILSSAPSHLQLSIATPVLYGLDTLEHFFEWSVDKSIDILLDEREGDKARQICVWRNRDPRVIELLEAVQCVISCEELSAEQAKIIGEYGDADTDKKSLLKSIAKSNGWRFDIISLHYEAADRLKWPTTNLLQRKTSEFLESRLSVDWSNWDLVRALFKTSRMSPSEGSSCLARSYAAHIESALSGSSNASLSNTQLSPDDYRDRFLQFAKLCENPAGVGESLFEIAKGQATHRGPGDSSPSDADDGVACRSLQTGVVVNLLLHASQCASDVDKIAELLDGLLSELANDDECRTIIRIVSVFPEPALIPRFFQYIITKNKVDSLDHESLDAKVGRVIMNCARHHQPFEPTSYFDLTKKYGLFRDHAELQMEHGLRLLKLEWNEKTLQDASHHLLLALAYFLHEKCYSMSMECLKKMSLIAVQQEMSDTSVMNLDRQQVMHLMSTRDFPFALTIAVAYDMDSESNWSEVIFSQCVQKQGGEFLTAFQYFRPITSTLCDAVVRRYKAATATAAADGMQERMKSFLANIPNLVERYRIAKSLDFRDQIESMKAHNPVVCEWCERVSMGKQ